MLGAVHASATHEGAAILYPEHEPGVQSAGERSWYAAFTMPQSERSVARHLDTYSVETFLPVFEEVHVWKNRQRKKIVKPLFPSYIFVCVTRLERRLVYRAPGVLRLVGNASGPLPVLASEMECLRSLASMNRLEPYPDVVLGERVRIASGPMRGMEGTLVRKKSELRFVLSVSLIRQHAALEINAEDIEPIGR